MKKVAIVVPTIREKSINQFLEEWGLILKEKLYIVEDNPEKTFKLKKATPIQEFEHYSWKDIDKELGKDSWIIPRKTDCVRSFGIYKAYKDGADYIITLDDDCYPYMGNTETFFDDHVNALEKKFTKWVWTTQKVKPRGVPYRNLGDRQVVINMGFWNGVADMDAITQLIQGEISLDPNHLNPVPPDYYFPMSGMNLSFRREIAPIMYFLLMGKDNTYERFGDIWCGIIAKTICDHLGYAITAGSPIVSHQRASNVWTNLEKEQKGLIENENFWQMIDKMWFMEDKVESCYLDIASQLPNNSYYSKLKEAMKIWIKLMS